jgi:hypothetical protein
MDIKKINKFCKKIYDNTDENIQSVAYGFKIKDKKITNERSITFVIKKKKPLNELKEDEIIPNVINFEGENIKTDIIEVKNIRYNCECDSEFLNWLTLSQQPENTYFQRPIKGGQQIYNVDSGLGTGTMGFLAIDNDDNTLCGITNNHVALDDGFISTDRDPNLTITNVSGDKIVQPFTFNQDYSIGKIKKYSPFKENNYSTVDATVIAIDFNEISETESWKQIGLNGITTPPPFATTEELDDIISTSNLWITHPNGQCYSSGARTGPKGEGNVKLFYYTTYPTISISHYRQGNEVTTYFNDIMVYVAIDINNIHENEACLCPYPSYRGDSGSAVIADINGVKKIIGLLFGGQEDINGVSYFTLFHRIDQVASALNITEWDGTTPDYSDLDNIEECVVSGQISDETIIKDGKKFWQVGITNSTNICTPD